TALYHAILSKLREHGLKLGENRLKPVSVTFSSGQNAIVPPARSRYLAEIAETVRAYHAHVRRQAAIARERQQLREARRMLDAARRPSSALDALIAEREIALSADAKALLDGWPQLRSSYQGEEQVVRVRDREIRTALTTTSLSGTRIPKVALPKYEDEGEL